MPSRKPKKFCRLTKYLEVIDKDLHQTLDDLCLFSLFRTRGTRGVTFLYPTDKSYRKKIIDLAYSNTPEKAIDMVKALVIMDYLPKPIDFKNKKDDIPNSLRKKLEVDDADSSSVKLKGGLKLSLATDFVPMRSEEQVCVYNLSGKGELSTSGPPTTMKYNQSKSGGSCIGGSATQEEKKSIARFVESTYLSGPSGKNVYKFVMGGVYAYILAKSGDDNDVSRIYEGLCASARAEFYLIMAPHGATNTYIDDTMLTTVLSEHIKSNEWEKRMGGASLWYNQQRNGIIDMVRNKKNINYNEKRDSIHKLQKSLLNSINDPSTYSRRVAEAYDTEYGAGNTSHLSKDLLTVYCYLASCSEHDDVDDSYYSGCFLYVMKNLFNKPETILLGTNDLAHNLTLYGNLIKSDAFMYLPHKSNEETSTDFVDLTYLPEPTHAQKMFTITRSNKMIMYGGSSSEADALFGGVGASHASTVETAMGDGI
jgi:hypothetical protein